MQKVAGEPCRPGYIIGLSACAPGTRPRSVSPDATWFSIGFHRRWSGETIKAFTGVRLTDRSPFLRQVFEFVPNPQFFIRHNPLTIGEICSIVGATLLTGERGHRIHTISALSNRNHAVLAADLDADSDADGSQTQHGARAEHVVPNEDLRGALVFVATRQSMGQLGETVCGLVLTTPALAGEERVKGKSRKGDLTDREQSEPADFDGDDFAIATVHDPRLAFSEIARRLYSSREETAPAYLSTPPACADATARVAPTALLGENVSIGPYAVIGDGVEIGANTHVGAGAVISHAIIGADCRIGPHSVIGGAGFGFSIDQGIPKRNPQLGIVRIGDRVEIGASCTIDRGAIGDTVIGADTKIDNLVQIAHNVRLGRACILAAQVGIAGSTELGDGVLIGGQGGVADHLTIGHGAQIAARAGLMRNVPDGERWGGYPAKPVRQWLRENALVEKLHKKK